MQRRRLGTTDLQIAPFVLGGNVFGWTADRKTSFAILDAFLEAGGNTIDTADLYNRYAPGLEGGESETMIGEWMRDRGVRDEVVIITKLGYPMGEGMEGLSAAYMPRACEASLRRLQTDRIDIYMAHRPDPEVSVEETLEAFQALIDGGKIRYAACSNFSAPQLEAALAVANSGGARFSVVEPRFNLVQQEEYVGALEDLCIREKLGVITSSALAAGFLTGKYRSAQDLEGSARKKSASTFLTEDGLKLLDRLDQVAARHGVTAAQVALAWVMARPSVNAPIASATSVGQLQELLKSTEIQLDAAELTFLTAE